MSFKPIHNEFKFVGWERSGNKVHFKYSLDDKKLFTETLEWPKDTILPETKEFNRAADAYHLLAGVSYYKAHLALKIRVASQDITEAQASFLSDTYKQGLGEFLFINSLDPKLIATFEATTKQSASGNIDGKTPLVLIGGGKDSLVSVDLLGASDTPFETFRVNPQPWIEDQLEMIGAFSHSIKRTIDPQLIEENKRGALNGHVPITSIISAAAVLQACVSGNSAVITSNEASANVPNTEHMGLEINHQYSKTLEFEKGFATYIKDNIASDLEYFSLLRPWTELKISEYFALNVLPKYSKKWSSSNHNFKVEDKTEAPEWDVTSPKTLSVFGMLAAFVGRDELLDEFGVNGFGEGDPDTWAELLGISGFKPFECVADIDEMRIALHMAQQSGNWPELLDFDVPQMLFDDYKKDRPHRIPKDYQNILPPTV